MAVESKPLFHPEVMRQQVRSFVLPERVPAWQPKLQHWASLIASGRADEFKETSLLPDFLTDIFCGLLGYTSPAVSCGQSLDAPPYTLSRERHVEVDGEFADAVLARFQKRKKGPLTAASVHALQDEYSGTIVPARALTAETLTLEHTLTISSTRPTP